MTIECLRCGDEFDAPDRFGPDYCETCLPIVAEESRGVFALPEPKAIGFDIQNTGDGFRTRLTTF